MRRVIIKFNIRWLLLFLTLIAGEVCAQTPGSPPHLGYIYPGGGRQGTVLRVLTGGQFLKGVSDALVTGDGVHATVIRHYKPLKKLEQAQRQELQRRLHTLWDQRWTERYGPNSAPVVPGLGGGKGRGMLAERVQSVIGAVSGGAMPEHPLLDNLDNLDIHGLANVMMELLRYKKRQPNPQIAEMALIEITIEPNAASGQRELRLVAAGGITNPMRFEVGALPEVREQEPNDPNLPVQLPELPAITLPAVLNGQVTQGDVDRFTFQAKAGRKLVISAAARRLNPYLADAVPGWFQAVMTLYDCNGHELAYSDDYGMTPDPVLFYTAPENGKYVLEIRDAIYRGREDFVYRITVGEVPFITQVFPLGGQMDKASEVAVTGWNLPVTRLTLDTQAGGECIRETCLKDKMLYSNTVKYAVASLAVIQEAEPNDTVAAGQEITPPIMLDGHIGQPGDLDVFRFAGLTGDEVVAEVLARRLGSPVDSMLRLMDTSGAVLAWNDDHEDKESGLNTHHADAYLSAKLPRDGTYCLQLSDTQRQGGDECAYRLRIDRPQPDFALCATPSSINARAGRAALITVHAIRKEGFDGDIMVTLKDAPEDFVLDGGRIPSGQDCICMTLTAPREMTDTILQLCLEGYATIGDKTVVHPAQPAEDMMQAFLYRHLVPSQALVLSVKGGKKSPPPIALASPIPVRIPVGGATQVTVRAPFGPRLQEVRLALNEPPKGVMLEEVTVAPKGVSFTLKADKETAKVGGEGNLIVEAFIKLPDTASDGKKKLVNRNSLGLLPAIPYELVEP